MMNNITQEYNLDMPALNSIKEIENKLFYNQKEMALLNEVFTKNESLENIDAASINRTGYSILATNTLNSNAQKFELRGNTLKNLVQYRINGGLVELAQKSHLLLSDTNNALKINTIYTIIYTVDEISGSDSLINLNLAGGCGEPDIALVESNTLGRHIQTFKFSENNFQGKGIHMYAFDKNLRTYVSDVMIFEGDISEYVPNGYVHGASSVGCLNEASMIPNDINNIEAYRLNSLHCDSKLINSSLLRKDDYYTLAYEYGYLGSNTDKFIQMSIGYGSEGYTDDIKVCNFNLAQSSSIAISFKVPEDIPDNALIFVRFARANSELSEGEYIEYSINNVVLLKGIVDINSIDSLGRLSKISMQLTSELTVSITGESKQVPLISTGKNIISESKMYKYFNNISYLNTKINTVDEQECYSYLCDSLMDGHIFMEGEFSNRTSYAIAADIACTGINGEIIANANSLFKVIYSDGTFKELDCSNMSELTRRTMITDPKKTIKGIAISSSDANIWLSIRKGSLQVEEGDVNTYYQPYKTNISKIKVLMNDGLKAINNHYDSYDLCNNTITKRIGTLDLADVKGWSICSEWSKGDTVGFYSPVKLSAHNNAISSELPFEYDINKSDYECFSFPANNWVGVRLKASKLTTQDEAGLLKYLKDNNIRIYYVMKEPITCNIKEMSDMKLDGTQFYGPWGIDNNLSTSTCSTFYIEFEKSLRKENSSNNASLFSDSFEVKTMDVINSKTESECIAYDFIRNKLYLRIKNSRLLSESVDCFKNWLAINNVHVYCLSYYIPQINLDNNVKIYLPSVNIKSKSQIMPLINCSIWSRPDYITSRVQQMNTIINYSVVPQTVQNAMDITMMKMGLMK